MARIANLVVSIFALFLGVLAMLVGWMGYGGYIFGLPAIAIGVILYKRHGGLLPLLPVIFGVIGLAETVVVMHILIPGVEEALEEAGFKEEYISLPHTFEIGKGKMLKMVSLEVKKVDCVSRESFGGNYDVYCPREGFVFYLAKFRIKNVGGKILNPTDLPCCFELYTNQNRSYEALWFYQLTKKRGYKIFESSDEKYAENICEPLGLSDLYPEEETTGCVFFEVREGEQPIKLKFQIFVSTYYIKLS